MRNRRLPEQRGRYWEHGESHDEEADSAIGKQGTGQHHRHDGSLLSQSLGDGAGDGKRGAAVIHQFAEDTAKQEKREEIGDEAPRTLHEGQRPFGE